MLVERLLDGRQERADGCGRDRGPVDRQELVDVHKVLRAASKHLGHDQVREAEVRDSAPTQDPALELVEE